MTLVPFAAKDKQADKITLHKLGRERLWFQLASYKWLLTIAIIMWLCYRKVNRCCIKALLKVVVKMSQPWGQHGCEVFATSCVWPRHVRQMDSPLSCRLIFLPTVYGPCTAVLITVDFPSGHTWSRNLQPNFYSVGGLNPRPISDWQLSNASRPRSTTLKVWAILNLV